MERDLGVGLDGGGGGKLGPGVNAAYTGRPRSM